jgi:predicted nucleic acid-binding protein
VPYLADTSAWVKSQQRGAPAWLRQRFEELLLADEIVTCDIVRLELLHHESSPVSFRARSADLAALRSAPMDVRVGARALEVQARLGGRRGAKHRAVGLADYLIAAAAELAGLPVLHYDADYESIASATRQPHKWIAPRGSL